jgi:hypothetical protein
MDYKLRKKAVLFSVLAMLLSVLFFFLLIPSVDTPLDKKTGIAQTRIYTVDGELSAMDEFFKDILATTTPRAMDAMTDYILNSTFINASDLSCAFEQMAMVGSYRNYSITEYGAENTSDIKITIASGILDTFPNPDVAGPFYVDTPVTQFFYARNSSRLSTAVVRIAYYADPPDCPDTASMNVTVYIMNDLCGKPGRILDFGSTSYTFVTLVDQDDVLTIPFVKHYPVDRGEKLWIMVDTNYSQVTSTVCAWISSINASVLPESNQSEIKVSYFNALRMNDYFIEHFVENLMNYTNNNLSINFSYKVNHLAIAQTSPWDVTATMNVTYYIDDLYSSWKKESTMSMNVPISGLLDPLYVAGSKGMHNGTIQRNLSASSIDLIKGNFTLFNKTYSEGLYIWTGQAPSFLMRYSNNTNGSLLGIQSLIKGSWYVRANTSYIDFHFWNGTYFNCSQNEVFMPNSALYGSYFGNFTLDKLSVAYYGFDHAGDTNFTQVTC